MTQQRSNDEIRADLTMIQSEWGEYRHEARTRLTHDVEPLLDRVSQLTERLAQFGIPLTGDPARTFCEVCGEHFGDLPLHDYERHGLRADMPKADAVGEWVDRLIALWRESPNTRAEITARFSGLAWTLDHLESVRPALAAGLSLQEERGDG